MRLDILKALNTERAARRAAVVVTNQDSGEQRLITHDKIAADPLKDLLEAHLRSGKSGVEETAEVLKVSPETVMRDWRLAKVWLLREIQKR